MIEDSERVYNFQRVFNIRRGYGRRKDDDQPYRACGPVTAEEYESRAERYDKQLKEKIGFDPEGKSTVEKMKALRTYRENQYDHLRDAVYKRRGWNNNGIPTLEHLHKIGMDFPEVVEVVRNLQ
jgi:aldehyde:ferredoxin oxidoreductase